MWRGAAWRGVAWRGVAINSFISLLVCSLRFFAVVDAFLEANKESDGEFKRTSDGNFRDRVKSNCKTQTCDGHASTNVQMEPNAILIGLMGFS